jgi:diguanylate cyclase (GGDEF)-like protein
VLKVSPTVDVITEINNDRILVVENSEIYSKLIKNSLSKIFAGEIDTANSFDRVKELVGLYGDRYFLSLLNMSVEGAPSGEAVEFVCSRKIPSLVFTSNTDADFIKKIRSYGVIDYIFKENVSNLKVMTGLVKRLSRNRYSTALIVDDNQINRLQINALLSKYLFNTINAENGQEALEILKDNPNIDLLITDYMMPVMDGFELIKKVREQQDSKDLAIIGISANSEGTLASNFMRFGADDFVTKPFGQEEFCTRVSICMDKRDLLQELSKSATTDFLTGLSNRRHFLDKAVSTHASFKRQQLDLSCVMLDIDHFKNVNDTYGHDAGDQVLVEVSRVLKERIRDTDLLARFGGEEFCLLAVNAERGETHQLFEEIRKLVSSISFQVNGQTFSVTISMGVCDQSLDTLDQMIQAADGALYLAKNAGRNRIEYAR